MKLVPLLDGELRLLSSMRDGRLRQLKTQAGKIGYILLWLLGVPIPVLFLFFLLRGCT